MASTLRARLSSAWRPLRRGAHRAISAARGGRGVRVRAAAGWTIAVSPSGYEDLRYWLDYEGPTFALIRRIWRAHMNVLDVGAHHGLFSLCCCKPGAMPGRVVTVEPSPDAQPLLRANRAVHPSLDWTIAPVAAGEFEGTLRLHPGYIHMLVIDPGLHDGHGEPAARPAVEVRVATLDNICREAGLQPDLIKFDVEAYEAEALRGARTILKSRPLVILEWHCAMLQRRDLDPLHALDPLIEAGYTFEPYEYPALGTLTASDLAQLPPRDLYRLLCQ